MGSAVHIILQARINSTRLPGKALMPVKGVPSAVLAGLRAARSGFGLTVATPDTAVNDPLAAAFQAAGLRIFRGDEQDVLGRFAAAVAGLADDTLLIRLTGDNVFPDADFVSLLAETLLAKDAEIIGTHSAKGLPYGLSAEAFRLPDLRRAAASAASAFDREHVTPWLYRNLRGAPFDMLDGEQNLSCLRCTLDIQDDYQTLIRVFEDVSDPVGIGCRDLVARLPRLQDDPKN
jgi:spore coat polysaccharide biosynthesis protein SpsF